MAKSTLSRRGKNRVAAILSLGGLVVAACSAMSDQPAPVYTVRIVSTGISEAASPGPVVREMAGPVALAPSMAPPTAMGQPASAVIPLDNPPPQAAPAFAKRAAEPVVMATAPPPAPAPMPAPEGVAAQTPTATPEPVPALVASPVPAVTPPAAPPVAAAARAEPSAAELARAEPAPVAVRGPVTAEPAAGDIATPGLFVKVKDERARYRPRYYYSP
jgi:hypothetical protein